MANLWIFGGLVRTDVWVVVDVIVSGLMIEEKNLSRRVADESVLTQQVFLPATPSSHKKERQRR